MNNIVKKCLSFILILQFVFFNSGCAFAKEFYNKPNDIEIKKKNLKLESFLGKTHQVNRYSFKNNGNNTYVLNFDSDMPEEVYKTSSKDFRKDMAHRAVPDAILIGTASTILLGFVAALLVLFPPAGVLMIIMGQIDGEALVELGKQCFIRPIKSVAMFPYDVVKNIKGTKKAKKELKKYKSYVVSGKMEIEIRPGGAFEFYAFVRDMYKYDDGKIYFKITDNDNSYGFNY